MGRQVSGWLLALIAWFVGLTPSSLEASVNLPLHHWAYEAIERLTALGVIEHAMVVTKPYSRKQAAKYVARALERIKQNHASDDGLEVIAGPLLERLVREFRPELVDLGVLAAGPRGKPGPIRYGGRAQVEVDSFQVGQGEVRFRENRGGEYYADGTLVQTDIRGWVELTDAVALSAQPKFISDSNVLGLDNSRNVYLRELNAKLSLFNIAVQVGRGSLWWGPGYHGSLLLTDHAFPLDMVQVGSDEPFRLPWVFKSLGDWKVNTFLTRLERDRDFPRANIFGLRVSYQPTSWLELGIARLTQFDGRGRNQSFPKTVADTYFGRANQGGAFDVNEQAMIDFRTRLPHVPYLIPFPAGLQLYGEIGSEDKFLVSNRAAILAGIYIPQLFSGRSMDLRIEYADTDLSRRIPSDHPAGVWYNHGLYTSGMRYRGFPLGHHMGSDGIDLFIRTTRYLTENVRLGGSLNYQERGRGLPVHERKHEAATDLTWWISHTLQLSVGYTYQRIKHPGQVTSINPFVETFPAGVTSTNHFFWTNLAFEF